MVETHSFLKTAVCWAVQLYLHIKAGIFILVQHGKWGWEWHQIKDEALHVPETSVLCAWTSFKSFWTQSLLLNIPSITFPLTLNHNSTVINGNLNSLPIVYSLHWVMPNPFIIHYGWTLQQQYVIPDRCQTKFECYLVKNNIREIRVWAASQ